MAEFETSSEQYVGGSKYTCQTCEPEDTKQRLLNKLVSFQGAATSADADRARSALSNVPTYLLQRVYDNGGRILVVGGKVIASEYDPGNTGALAATYENRLAVIPAQAYDFKGCVLHELGHVVSGVGTPGSLMEASPAFVDAIKQDEANLHDFDRNSGEVDGQGRIPRRAEEFAESFKHFYRPDEDWKKTHEGETLYWKAEPLKPQDTYFVLPDGT